MENKTLNHNCPYVKEIISSTAVINELKEEMKELKTLLVELKKDFKENYVTQKEFIPIRNGFYSLVGFACLGIAGIIGSMIFDYLSKK